MRNEGGWRSFVAVGDSFTEGMDDPYPDGRTYRGWADLVAHHLARLARPDDFRYANLAIRGRLFNNVVDEQVPLAIAMKPDLVSFAAGGNDVLRRHFDPNVLAERYDRTIERIRATGADVLIFRFADLTKRLPGGRLVRSRVDFVNNAVEETAKRHDAHLVDLWSDAEFANTRMWSVDRLHLSLLGHRRVAGHVLRTLRIAPREDWMINTPPPDALSWLSRRAADARWARFYFAPWVKRRLTGRSSGDTVTAKRPELLPMVSRPDR
jgi:lysophospholipase L1-like esterase